MGNEALILLTFRSMFMQPSGGIRTTAQFLFVIHILQCETNPPCGFCYIFHKWLGIFNQFLDTYYTLLSALDYKFLFSLQL